MRNKAFLWLHSWCFLNGVSMEYGVKGVGGWLGVETKEFDSVFFLSRVDLGTTTWRAR